MKAPITGIVLAALVLALAAPPVGAAGDAPLDSQVLAVDLQGNPTFIKGELGVLVERNRRVAAVNFLKTLVVDSFGAAGTEELVATKVTRDRLGTFHVRVAQRIAGLPVVGAELIVHARQGSGEVYAVNGRGCPCRLAGAG
jgi:vibriolysin